MAVIITLQASDDASINCILNLVIDRYDYWSLAAGMSSKPQSQPDSFLGSGYSTNTNTGNG